ncbi:MAG TPA: hypothetical protein PLG66_08150, partial [Calditrichia bacterium]|nr:hypothetical protein [Calditrichia bacterium]
TLLVILSSIIFGITVFIYMGAYTAGTLESLSTGALIRQTLRGIARAVGLYLPFGLFMALFLFPLMIVPVAGVLAVFGLVVYGAVILTMGYAALIIENRGIGESVRRAVDLLKGLWWQTFGLLVTLAIQTYLFMIVILIPLVVTLALTSANTPEGTLPFENIGWVAALASFLYFSVAAIMQMVFNIAIGVQYFNLSERKEMTGLLNKLEAIEVRIEEPLSDPPTAETEPGSGV